MIYDYIVIGSGFGGSVASLRLVEKGYTVLTLEQGKRYNPGDFPKTNWNLPKYLWLPVLRFFGFQKLSFYSTASILSGTGVGGGSLVYANTLYIPPDDFFNNLSWQRFGDWKKILKPFYDRASFMLGRKKYSKLNIEDQVLGEVSVEMNAHDTFDSVYVGVNIDGSEKEADPYFNGLGPLRKGCTECAGCMVGCRENAKNTLDRNYLWFAKKMGVEILPETKAEKISFHDNLYHVETSSVTSFGFEEFDEVYGIIEQNPKPLATYIFSRNKKLVREFIRKTQSGNASVNETVMQIASPYLPYGGVGYSGMGRYHGKKSFDTFSNLRSVLVKSNLMDIPIRYPPYSGLMTKIVSFLMR